MVVAVTVGVLLPVVGVVVVVIVVGGGGGVVVGGKLQFSGTKTEETIQLTLQS